jgi:hypothetical protein
MRIYRVSVPMVLLFDVKASNKETAIAKARKTLRTPVVWEGGVERIDGSLTMGGDPRLYFTEAHAGLLPVKIEEVWEDQEAHEAFYAPTTKHRPPGREEGP